MKVETIYNEECKLNKYINAVVKVKKTPYSVDLLISTNKTSKHAQFAGFEITPTTAPMLKRALDAYMATLPPNA